MLFTLKICVGLLGLFLAAPLMALARRRRANLWLGLFVFSMAWLSLADLYSVAPWLFCLFDIPLGIMGPCYYLYVRSMVGLPNTRRQAWHFLPGAAWVILLLALRSRMGGVGALDWLMDDGLPVFIGIVGGFQAAALAYAVAILLLLRKYRRRVREVYSSTEGRDLAWLHRLTIAVGLLLLAWLPAFMGSRAWTLVLLLGQLVTLYALGWHGLRQAEVFLPGPAPAASPPAPEPEPEPEPAARPAPKYERSGMSAAAAGLIGNRLRQRMETHRDFCESDIKLADLADRIGTSPQLLSQYLNDILGYSFFDYINGLRVAEAQRLLADPAFADRPVLDLAFEAGFNSKSTFNASFKKISGLSPSGWRRQALATSEPIGADAI